jgi:hypothetical protein
MRYWSCEPVACSSASMTTSYEFCQLQLPSLKALNSLEIFNNGVILPVRATSSTVAWQFLRYGHLTHPAQSHNPSGARFARFIAGVLLLQQSFKPSRINNSSGKQSPDSEYPAYTIQAVRT